MGYEKDAEMLRSLNDTLSEVKQSASSGKGSVYSWEEPRNFSTDSMSFEDITAGIMEQTEDLFAVTRTCDRFSPEYLKLCKLLVRSVNHLGSCYLTKTALIIKHYDESKLKILTSERLYEMMSFNFRKTEAALNEKKQTKKEFDTDLFTQMLTFAQVMGRLRTTQNRVRDLELGIKDSCDYVRGTHSFNNGDGIPCKRDKQAEPYREYPSYELRREVLQEAEIRKQLEAAAEESALPEPVSAAVSSADGEGTVIEGSYVEKEEPAVPEESVSSEIEPAVESGISETGSLPPCVSGGLPSDRPKLITGLPSYKEVLDQVFRRGGISADGVMHLTIDEICTMLCDEEFRRDEPEMAEHFYQILGQYDDEMCEDEDADDSG